MHRLCGDGFTVDPGLYIDTRSRDLLPETPRNREVESPTRRHVVPWLAWEPGARSAIPASPIEHTDRSA